ncbi:MAG: winged helix-turn-helix transcriptional regulator, partial [Bacteroidota bacterium]
LKNKVKDFFVRSVQNRDERGFCITQDVMAALLDKWSLFVVYNLGYYGTLRFSELKTKIKSISGRMLSVTLKKLEAHGLISRRVYPEVPPRVEYQLTDFGQALAGRTIELNAWLLDHYYPTTQTPAPSPVASKKSPPEKP